MSKPNSDPNFRNNIGAIRPAPGGRAVASQPAHQTGFEHSPGSPASIRAPGARWVQSARQDVWVKLDSSGQISDYRLDRELQPHDVLTLSEAAAFVRKSSQTLRNWAVKEPAFPAKKMGGHWVVIRPYLDAYLLHADAQSA